MLGSSPSHIISVVKVTQNSKTKALHNIKINILRNLIENYGVKTKTQSTHSKNQRLCAVV